MSERTRDIFVRNLRYFRQQRNFSQERLSRIAGMSKNCVNQIECRRAFPSPETIDRMATALCVTPAQLFGEAESPQNIMAARTDSLVAALSERVRERLQDDIRAGIAEAVAAILKEPL